ncbi:MAG: hypothetical protein ACYDD1_01245 [Caulobacteraceae bacterium]
MFDAPPGSVGLVLNLLVDARQFMVLNESARANFEQAILDFHEMVDVEQKFDLLLANLLELEQELASRSLAYAFRSGHGVEEMLDDMQALNRRLINLLTSARLYIDQAKHHIKVFFPRDPAAWASLNKAFSDEYDGWLAYRVMEAVRNYGQHRGLPLQGFTHAGRWLDINSPGKLMETNVALNLETEYLAKDPHFKKRVLRELQEFGSVIDIKLMIRECLGRVHTKFRMQVADHLDQARVVLNQGVEQFKALESNFKGTEGLVLAKIKHDGRAYDVIAHYPTHTLTYLEALQARSQSLVNLSRRFVTTAPMPAKK